MKNWYIKTTYIVAHIAYFSNRPEYENQYVALLFQNKSLPHA